MKFEQKHFPAVFLIVLIFSGLGLLNLSRRPGLPFPLQAENEQIVIVASSGEREGTVGKKITLSAIDGFHPKSLYQVSAILERKKIGEKVRVEFADGTAQDVPLVARNDSWYIVMNGVLAGLFLLIGALVWWKSKAAEEIYFSLSSLFFALIIAVSWPGVQLPRMLAIPLVGVYFLGYPQAFLFFLLFCYHFPYPSYSRAELKLRKLVFPGIGIAFSVVLLIYFFRSAFSFSLPNLDHYHQIYRLFRIFILFSFLLSLLRIFQNLQKNPTPVNRHKTQWVVWGIIWGGFPFIFLWSLPQIILNRPLIPEWIAYLFVIIIPAGIAIAILKYRLFDIELVLSRSLIYSSLLVILVTTYLLSAGGLSLLILRRFSFRSPFISVAAALIIALMFDPLKNTLRQQIDRKFFRIRYDRFICLQNFLNDLKESSSIEQVLSLLDLHYRNSIALTCSRFLIVQREKWKPLGSADENSRPIVKWLAARGAVQHAGILVNQNAAVNVEAKLGVPNEPFPLPWVVLIPVGEGCLWLLGEKQAGTRFWKEDLDLARQMAGAAASQVEKINYFQRSLREAFQKDQAQKMSRWKSLLVAEVAHDLQSPLNTMLWKLKSLQSELETGGKIDSDQPVREIEQQINRISGFIRSLLTLSQIEQKKFRLQKQAIRVCDLLREIVADLRVLSEQKSLAVQVDCQPQLMVRGERFILQEIVQNVLQNAMKFSPPQTAVRISARETLRRNKKKVHICVEDRAGGIATERLKSIFEPFAEEASTGQTGHGFHLGMYIVKEFTGLLQGEVRIQSRAGVGTVVNLYFPFAE